MEMAGDHGIAYVSDALNQDFIDRADRFYEFTDQIARRLLEPKSED
jgi:hypothetical protein